MCRLSHLASNATGAESVAFVSYPPLGGTKQHNVTSSLVTAAARLLTTLSAHGFKLTDTGTSLRVTRLSGATTDLDAETRAVMAGVINDLQPQLVRLLVYMEIQRMDEDQRHAWEERAAIMEYDGGLPRADAEFEALRQLVWAQDR